MKRRRVLRALFAAPMLLVGNRPALHATPSPHQPLGTVLYEVYVAGMQHHKPYQRRLMTSVLVGAELVLKREPDNPYDHRAIAVFLPNGVRLGYLPQWINKIPSRLLDAGEEVQCSIVKFNCDDDPWHMVKVAISLVHPARPA